MKERDREEVVKYLFIEPLKLEEKIKETEPSEIVIHRCIEVWSEATILIIL